MLKILKKFNIHIFLISLLIIIINFGIPIPNFKIVLLPESYENTFHELIQVLILTSSLLILIIYRSTFFRFSNKSTYYIKIIIFSFLIYEETSYITKGLSPFFNTNNDQNEINFHNLNILNNPILNNIYIPFTDIHFNISYSFFFIGISSLILGFGGFIKKLNKLNLIFLESKFSLYFLISFAKLIPELISREFFSYDIEVLSWEEIEFFIYIIFFVDTIFKLKKFQNKLINKKKSL
tara:strand:+ start:183 stop:893 length:711 start_codon:yes stop_codon:yes gene_type:complete